jgi:hypothetical protein
MTAPQQEECFPQSALPAGMESRNPVQARRKVIGFIIGTTRLQYFRLMIFLDGRVRSACGSRHATGANKRRRQ